MDMVSKGGINYNLDVVVNVFFQLKVSQDVQDVVVIKTDVLLVVFDGSLVENYLEMDSSVVVVLHVEVAFIVVIKMLANLVLGGIQVVNVLLVNPIIL